MYIYIYVCVCMCVCVKLPLGDLYPSSCPSGLTKLEGICIPVLAPHTP